MGTSLTSTCLTPKKTKYQTQDAADASMALALSAPAPRMQLGVYSNSASWQSELG